MASKRRRWFRDDIVGDDVDLFGCRGTTRLVSDGGRLTDPAASFAGTSGTEIKLPKARDPWWRGGVERIGRFFRGRVMPGRVFA